MKHFFYAWYKNKGDVSMDKIIQCKDCTRVFLFSAEQQKWFRKRKMGCTDPLQTMRRNGKASPTGSILGMAINHG